jgi:hypothetical protein
VTTYHGAECELRVERLSAEGKIVQEYLGTLDGSASNQTFYTSQFPITTNAGVETDDETEVDVYTDDGVPGSWSEYLDDGSDFTIVGATGAVTIQAAENQGGNAGERISISYYTAYDIGYAQSATVDWDGGLINVHELGTRGPVEIKEGHINIRGTITRFRCDRRFTGLVIGMRDLYQSQPGMTFRVFPGGNSSGEPRITVTGAKFGAGSFSQDLDGLFQDNVTFLGLATAEDTVP